MRLQKFTFLVIAIVLQIATNKNLSYAQQSIIANIQLAMPSIVEVHAKGTVLFKGPNSAFLDQSSGHIVQAKGVRAVEINNSGSGVIIDPAGIIVTNAHIISHAGKIAVVLYNKTTVAAKLLKVVDGQDLAFLKIDPPYPLTRVEFASSQSIQLGEEVITVGSSPFLKETISAGRITGLGQSRQQELKDQTAIIKVSINIYHGDSGGPLFNQKGHLVGLMVASQLKEDRSSFAIPSDTILQHYISYLKSVNP